MSDAEDDVHVCDICQEIFLGNDELEEHMKEDHAMKEEPATKEVVFLQISTLSVHIWYNSSEKWWRWERKKEVKEQLGGGAEERGEEDEEAQTPRQIQVSRETQGEEAW